MKDLLIIGLVAVCLWCFLEEEKTVPQPIAALFKQADPTEEFITISDPIGRELSCKIIAKRKSFIRIQREADGRLFTLSFESLYKGSRTRLEKISDFNESSLHRDLLKLAVKEITPELLYIPELCSTKCRHTGQRIQSSEGLLVDTFRNYLRGQGFEYKEVNLRLEKTGTGRFNLPAGMTKTPCIRIGETIIYRRNKAQIQHAIVDYYVEKNSS